MRPYELLYHIVNSHWRIPLVVVYPNMDPGKRVAAGYLWTNWNRVEWQEDLSEEQWRHRPPRELYGQPRQAWVDYVHRHMPGAVVARRTPYLHLQWEETDSLMLLRSMLDTAPHWIDSVPGAREMAQNLLVLHELSGDWY